MNTVVHRAVLHFLSNTNEPIRISIPRACLELQGEQARSVMDAMIMGGIIVTGTGRPAAIKGAEVITTQRLSLV
jgi:hypothetical protein